MKKIKLLVTCLLLLWLGISCCTDPEIIYIEDTTEYDPVPQKPKSLILNPTTKEAYRYNTVVLMKYSRELENWIYTYHEDLKNPPQNEED